MVSIPLSGGYVCHIDDEDFDLVGRHKWSAHRGSNAIYAVRVVREVRIFMHRLLLNAKKGEIVDHIDMNTLNNSRNNIRICTASQSQSHRSRANWRGTKTSKFKGVTWLASERKWAVKMRIANQSRTLGRFSCETSAAMAADEAAAAAYGEFAYLNFPPPMQK